MNQHDPLLPASEIEEADRRRAKASLDQRQRDADLTWLMGNPTGRRVMWQLVDALRTLGPSISESPVSMARHEGERKATWAMVQRLMRVCPDFFLLMVNENK